MRNLSTPSMDNIGQIPSIDFLNTDFTRAKMMNNNALLGSLFNNQNSQFKTQTNPSLIDLLIRQNQRPRLNSLSLPNIGSHCSQSQPDVFNSIESVLFEYLLSLPTCLDEFYKVLGELYVSELLKNRPDIGSATHLMKELLLGRFNSAQPETFGPEIVATMMEQAAMEDSRINMHQNLSETGILNMLLQEKIKESTNLQKINLPESHMTDSINMVDILKTYHSNTPTTVQDQNPVGCEAEAESEMDGMSKKRDIKACHKQLVSQRDISQLDTHKNTLVNPL